jgi:hypothetical protein
MDPVCILLDMCFNIILQPEHTPGTRAACPNHRYINLICLYPTETTRYWRNAFMFPASSKCKRGRPVTAGTGIVAVRIL